MANTPNLNLKRPGSNDNYNIQDNNDNMDIIDAIIGALSSLNTTDKDSIVNAINEVIVGLVSKLNSSAYTAADVLTKIKTVDGPASGLDADLLDGNEAAAFATSAQGTKADNALPSMQTLPSVDHTANGIKATVAIDSGTTVAVGEVLYQSTTGYKKAKADVVGTMPACVLALEAGTGGNRSVLLFGFFKDASYGTMTIGARAYVSIATAGAVTTTQPSTTGNQIQDLGCFVAADTLFFNPNAVFVEK